MILVRLYSGPFGSEAPHTVRRIPVRLTRDPIIEALFEVRFEAKKSSLSDLLPGVLYGKLGERFPRLDRLPASYLPRELQKHDPDLRYQARNRLASDQFLILIGDNSLTVSCLRPYVGWESFQPLILEVLSHLKDSGMVGNAERYSVKYLNLFPGEIGDFHEQYRLIEFAGALGRFPLTNGLTMVRTEIHADAFINIVEFSANATVRTIKEEQNVGLLLSIDTISKNANGFWDNPRAGIEAAHTTEKAIFYDLLSDAAGEVFGAVWE